MKKQLLLSVYFKLSANILNIFLKFHKKKLFLYNRKYSDYTIDKNKTCNNNINNKNCNRH